MRGRLELKQMVTDPVLKEIIESLWRDYLGLYNEKFDVDISLDNEIDETVISALALGQDHKLYGNESFALGYGSITRSYRETLLGTYPEDLAGTADSWVATDRLLAIGNGTAADDRNDALRMYKSGYTHLKNALRIGEFDHGDNLPETGALQYTLAGAFSGYHNASWNRFAFIDPLAVDQRVTYYDAITQRIKTTAISKPDLEYHLTDVATYATKSVSTGTGQILSSFSSDAKGHVTGVSLRSLLAADIPALAISQVTGLQTALDLKVTGSASATDNAIARFDGITGKLIQDSSVTISDVGHLVASQITANSILRLGSGEQGMIRFGSAYGLGNLAIYNGLSIVATIDSARMIVPTLKTTVTTGTPPLIVESATLVTNLNADLLDGQHGSYYAAASSLHSAVTVTDSSSIDFTLSTQNITASVLPGGVDHNQLLNYSANRHIDHSAVSITAGAGLTGGGDITTSRTIAHGAGSWLAKIALTGAMVLSNLSVDGYGHPVDWTTRAMTYSDVGAAPASGSANYIQNQNAAAQNANMWISGSGTINGLLIGYDNVRIPTNTAGLWFNETGFSIGIYRENSDLRFISQTPFLFNHTINAPAFQSTIATGTAPLSVASTTLVSNLNADLLDGYHASSFQLALTNPITGIGTSGYLPKWTGSSTQGNSQIFDDGTNVGIGTTSPVAKLEVFGPMRITGTSAAGYQFTKLADDTYLNLAYYTDATTKYKDLISFNYDGNVGIATTSPLSTSKLDVNGEYAKNSVLLKLDWLKSTGIGTSGYFVTSNGTTPGYTAPSSINLSGFTNDLGNYGGFLTSFTETDPTVPAWAKQPTKPSYTYSEVGAASSTHDHTGVYAPYSHLLLSNPHNISLSGLGYSGATNADYYGSFGIGINNTISDAIYSGNSLNFIAGTGISLSYSTRGNITITATGGSGMVYPGAGIAVSNGSGWGTSITNNSANWNTAYGWGNHAGLYEPAISKSSTGYLRWTGSAWTIDYPSLYWDLAVPGQITNRIYNGGVLTMNAGSGISIVTSGGALTISATGGSSSDLNVALYGSSTGYKLSTSYFKLATDRIEPDLLSSVTSGDSRAVRSSAIYSELAAKAALAGSTSQAFSAQKLTLPNGFTIETDATYLYIKKDGSVCSKINLTAHLANDHQKL